MIPGNIIVRQRGTLFHPGQHVRNKSAKLVHNSLIGCRLKWAAIKQFTQLRQVLFASTKKNGCMAKGDLWALCWNVVKSFLVTKRVVDAAVISG